MTFNEPDTDFQKEFNFDDIYTPEQIRELIGRYFPAGEQSIPGNYRYDLEEKPIPFTGLGEIVFYPTEDEYQNYSDREANYRATHRTDIPREKLLEELIPSADEGVLLICELDSAELNSGWETTQNAYRKHTTFDAIDGQYMLRSF